MIKEGSEERGPRGYPTLRINIHNDSTNRDKQVPLSPLVEETLRGVKPAGLNDGHSRRENGLSPTRIRINELYSRESTRPDQTLRLAQDTVAVKKATEFRGETDKRPRTIREEYRDSRRSKVSVDGYESWRPQPDQEFDRKERDLSISPARRKSSRRRRRDRIIEHGEFNWKGPSWHRDISPPKDDKDFAVTERYVYRPQHHSPIPDQQTNRGRYSLKDTAHGTRQEGIYDDIFGGETQYQQLTREAHLFDYLQDDWQRDVSSRERGLRQRDHSRDIPSDSMTMLSASRFNGEHLGKITGSLAYNLLMETLFM